MAKQSSPVYTISGTITDQNQQPISGLTVSAFDKDPVSTDDQLGQAAVTDDNGYYQISYTQADLDKGGRERGGADIYIKVYSGRALVQESEPLKNAPINARIDLVFSNVPGSAAEDFRYRVWGLVFIKSGKIACGLKGLTLKIYTCTITAETEIQTVLIQEGGLFDSPLEIRDASGLLLMARLFRWDGKSEVQVAQSGPHCIQEDIYLTFSYDPKDFSILYTELIQHIQPHVPEGNLGALKPGAWEKLGCFSCAEEQDMWRLRDAVGLSNQAQAAIKNCPDKEKNQPNSNEPYYSECNARLNGLIAGKRLEEVFFALSANGEDRTLSEVLTRSTTQFKAVGAKAINNKEVSFTIQEWEAQVPGLICLRNCLLFNATYDQTNYDAKLIHLSTHDLATKSYLLDEALDAGSLANFLSEDNQGQNTPLQRGGSTNPYNKAELESLILFDEQLLHFPPLLEKALSSFVKTPGVHDLAGIAGKTEKDWEAQINALPGTTKYPNEFAGRNTPIQDYAEEIALGFARSFPTAALADRIKQTKIPNRTTIGNLLKANSAFDISKQAVNTHFSTDPDNTNMTVISKKNMEYLQTLQRTVKLSGGAHYTNRIETLFLSGYTSAHAIMRLGKYGFVKESAQLGMSPKDANSIYCKAKAISDTVKYIATQYQRYEKQDALLPYVLQNGHAVAAAPKLGLPDMETLFGSLDTCTCEHCQSVYSPAAYLTDMLHWLNSDVVCQNTGINGFSELDARRPDIKHILLNCQNTDTLLPYIDLVNELLSIRLLAVPDYTQLQTTWKPEDLLVAPEHRFKPAEDKLKTVRYPLALPYDVEWTEARSYLKELNIDHAGLINRLNNLKYRQNNTLEWAKAYLGINDAEWSLLTETGITGNFWQVYLGLNASTNNVGTLIRSIGTDQKQFQAIYETYFVNQKGVLKTQLISGKNDCDWDSYTITSTLTPAVLQKWLRFYRLLQKCNLSIDQLDKIIYAFGNLIDNQCLISLASILPLSEKFRLNIEDVISWFTQDPFNANNAINKMDWSVYYQSRYQKGHFTNAMRTFLDPVRLNSASNTSRVNSLSVEKKDWINEACGFGVGDIELLNQSWFGSSNPKLTTKNFQFYHIHGLLSKATGLSIPELVEFYGRTGNPFDPYPNTPGEVFYFLAQVEAFQSLGIPLSSFNAIDLGTGRYELDANGVAVDPVFDTEAFDSWGLINQAIEETFRAFPNAYDANDDFNIIDATGNPPDISSVIYASLSVQFKIPLQETERIFTQTAPTWALSCVNHSRAGDPWTGSLAENFTPIFRYLKRIETFMDICVLNEAGLSAGIDSELLGTLNLPSNPFKWLVNSFGTSNFDQTIWIRRASKQAKIFGMSQYDFLQAASDLFNHTGTFDAAGLSGIIDHLFQQIGTDSPFRSLSRLQLENYYLRAQFIANQHNDLVDVTEAITQVFDFVHAVNIPLETLWNCTWAIWPLVGVTTGSNLGDYKNELFSFLKAANPDDGKWRGLIPPIHNRFRTKLRDALVAYYIGQLNFENANAIYAYFLIDPEMEACMKTSRLVLAISSVQLLVHRALMGLEINVCMDEDDKKEFVWRKNYRVWEANRKVFLYPENWIEPTLRLEKSPFFKDAEDVLLQDEINEENSEKAFSEYLSKLNEVARLDIRAMYVEQNGDPNPETIHVFGRTWNAPYIYFYRKRTPNEVWTPWERMDLDIEGDHLIPTFFNRKLYLFFPQFMEKEHRKIKKMIEGELQNAPYFEVKMYYSKYEFGKWTSKKILDGTLLAGNLAGPGVYNDLWRKLGQGIPPNQIETRPNPNFDPSIWYRHSPFGFSGGFGFGGFGPGGHGHGGYPDPFAPNGPFVKATVNGESYNGLKWTNSNFGDFYGYVSMKKSGFYFWPEKNPTTGDLTIHVRREFTEDIETWHLGYTELAFEDGFLISACDERVTIIPPPNDQAMFLARPYYTLPVANSMKNGLDRTEAEAPTQGVYVKKVIAHREADNPRIMNATHGDYFLVYPLQHKNALWDNPFFLGDQRHVFFVERPLVTECLCDRNGNDSTVEPTNCALHSSQSSKYQIQPHEHPYGCLMLSEFNRFGIDGLLDSQNSLLRRQSALDNFFPGQYQPVSMYINAPFPINQFDFSRQGAYSKYNWEIFFHLVSLIARQLRQNNKHAEAIRWLQFLFDPTNREELLGDLRVWKIKPFMKDVSDGSIQQLMRLLSASGLSPEDEQKRKDLVAQIEDWRDHPFEPHRIAEMRNRAYMLWTVMEYVETLTDWGDWLFRQDTMESINEATNLYILAAEILGRRPEKMDKKKSVNLSFVSILSGLDPFSNAALLIENQISGMDAQGKKDCESGIYCPGYTLPDLVFCIPDNPKLLEFWSRVEDRLFKIRHCMNIDGQVRQLPLFQPPIDPALLVRAFAMGIDISAVLADLAAPSPHYRYGYLYGRATDLCNEVKSLGGQLLAALEKKDGEELSLLRQTHEQNLLKAARNLKKMQIDEAKNNLASLQHSKKLIEIRLDDYSNREYISGREEKTISLTKTAEGFMYAEQGAELVSAVAAIFPDTYVSVPPLVKIVGGDKIAHVAHAVGLSFGIVSSVFRNKASMTSTYAGYDRRQEDWTLQIKTAKEELNQIEKQILGAEIRIAMAEKDLENHDLQVEQSKEVYDWLKIKFTNLNLYSWMAGELLKMFRRAYEMAYDMAKSAQKAMEKELGIESPGYITFGHWDSAKKGLLSGERLGLQLKELDVSYVKNNKREFELTKSVSLRLLDANALLLLIADGSCNVTLPEAIFNLDFPEHELQAMRIKSVALSLPCVTGPNTSTNVKLKLKRSTINWGNRTETNNEIAEVITSSGVNDAAVFEPSLKEEKYMPFENRGVDSEWEVSLPKTPEFDYSTISDLILHIRYVARRGAISVSTLPSNSLGTDPLLLMSFKHDFPEEWHTLFGNPTSILDVANSPALQVMQVPYKQRLLGNTTGTVTDRHMLYKVNGKMVFDNLTFTSAVINLDNKLEINGKVVEDIWLLYELQ